MIYLLDTNVVSEPLRSRPNASILRNLRSRGDESALPAPAWHELQFGCARLPASRRKTAIEQYLREIVLVAFPVLPYDQQAAEWHAMERARLTAVGLTPSFADGQIAAIAHSRQLILVTENRGDFERFRDIELQSWS